MENDKELNGSVVLVRGTSFLAKQIIFHMGILAKLKRRQTLKYSHAEFLLWNEDEKQLYTVGARESGTEITPVKDFYHGQEVLILKPKCPISKTDSLKLWSYFHKVDPSKYQTGNFLAWILYIKSKIWISKKGDKRNYCYELAARFANEVGRWPKSKSLDQVSVYDLYDNEYYCTN
jgi:hypothetical protein